MTYASATAPTDNPQGTLDEGDLWIDTDDNNKLYRWNGSAWKVVADSSALTTFITSTYTTDKTAIQNAINGKTTTYY